MASMREIKLRIKSVKETRQITNAMKLISAAKLKKARQQLEETLPYFDKVKTTIADILLHSGNIDNTFFDIRKEKENKKKGYVVITGDKGLAGGYNHNILKLAEKELESSPDSILFIPGITGRNYFTRKGCNMAKDFDYPVQNPTVYRAREIADILLDMFKKGEVDEVYVIYTKMISSIRLEPEVMKLLPLNMEALREDLKESRPVDESLVYEPSPKAVFDVLIPKYVKGIMYGTLVEAFTSEQNARMTAMDNATSNADEVLQKLNLYYNRARQASITQEITEIVGGAAALQ
ncbi:MAG: ATP synthase F1 subunit gamma [Bacillota bacterium]|nr:ATP synthase F1 subunit gamma [Bacillota bacterium]